MIDVLHLYQILTGINFIHMAKQIRNGKIHGRHQAVAGHWNGARDVAWLNLSGLWLEQAGFEVGDGIRVEVQQGQLIITKHPGHGDR